MAVNVYGQDDESGSIGEVTPGWSVQEYATPIISGARAGGAGGVSFSAKRDDESGFIINNTLDFTHSELGTVSGTVKSVNLVGPVASISQTTDLAVFDAEYELPGLVTGGVHQTVDLISQIVKRDVRLKSGLSGGFWSLAGHNAGFNSLGEMVDYKEYKVDYSWIGSPSNTVYKSSVTTCKDALWVESQRHRYVGYWNDSIYASFVRGDTIISDVNKPNYFVGFKTLVSSVSGYSEWAVQGYPFDSVTNTDREISIKITGTGNLQISCSYRAGGSVMNDVVNEPMVSIDPLQELAVFIEYNLVSVGDGFVDYQIVASVCNTSNYVTYVTATLNFTADAMPIYYDQWYLSDSAVGDQNYRSVWVDDSGAAHPVADWENAPSYSISDAVNQADLFSTAVLGGKYNLWQFLQDACSAHGQEVSVSNGIINVKLNGETIIDITNVVPSPSLSIETIFSGKSVDIGYSGSSTTTSDIGVYTTDREEIYNVYTDKNKIISVNAGEVITTTVKTDNYILSVLPAFKSSVFPNPTGAYAVSDSTGQNVVGNEWINYGGDVVLSVNEDDSSSIDIKLIGPTREIPGKPEPYSLAYSDGENKYAALSIVGTAILSSPEVLTLQTGAPDNKATQSSSGNIRNPHVGSIGKAYSSGIWVSSNASGPRTVCNATIPSSQIVNFGVTAGSLFRYEDAIYRIDNSTVGNIGVSLSASLFTTCDDFDTLWSSKTVEFHDGVWSSYQVQDQIVRPLWKATLSGVYMFFDTDGVVSWTDEPYGDATFALDTDGVPYVIDSGESEDNTLIYLDTDFTPYYV